MPASPSLPQEPNSHTGPRALRLRLGGQPIHRPYQGTGHGEDRELTLPSTHHTAPTASGQARCLLPSRLASFRIWQMIPPLEMGRLSWSRLVTSHHSQNQSETAPSLSDSPQALKPPSPLGAGGRISWTQRLCCDSSQGGRQTGTWRAGSHCQRHPHPVPWDNAHGGGPHHFGTWNPRPHALAPRKGPWDSGSIKGSKAPAQPEASMVRRGHPDPKVDV